MQSIRATEPRRVPVGPLQRRSVQTAASLTHPTDIVATSDLLAPRLEPWNPAESACFSSRCCNRRRRLGACLWHCSLVSSFSFIAPHRPTGVGSVGVSATPTNTSITFLCFISWRNDCVLLRVKERMWMRSASAPHNASQVL